YAEAKATGFEPKIMRQVVRLRAMDRDLLSEQDALLDTYRDALGLR
ncbi:MAG: GapR family DNA-binding domain-containing protein, partial [Candidatus Puniceispirillaceae bacterium]